MQTSLIDYSTISHNPVYMAPKSLVMAHRQELTYGIKLVFPHRMGEKQELGVEPSRTFRGLQLELSTKHCQTVLGGV